MGGEQSREPEPVCGGIGIDVHDCEGAQYDAAEVKALLADDPAYVAADAYGAARPPNSDYHPRLRPEVRVGPADLEGASAAAAAGGGGGNAEKPRKRLVKTILLGDAGVGKTSSMDRWVQDRFSDRYKATIGADFQTKEVPAARLLLAAARRGEVDDDGDDAKAGSGAGAGAAGAGAGYDGPAPHVTVQLWDTAGPERFQSLGVAFYRGSDTCIVIFSIFQRKSWENVPKWIEEFRTQASVEGGFPILVFGTHSRLYDPCRTRASGGAAEAEGDRKVSQEEAQAWCDEHGYPYYEYDNKAEDGANKRAFDDMVYYLETGRARGVKRSPRMVKSAAKK